MLRRRFPVRSTEEKSSGAGKATMNVHGSSALHDISSEYSSAFPNTQGISVKHSSAANE